MARLRARTAVWLAAAGVVAAGGFLAVSQTGARPAVRCVVPGTQRTIDQLWRPGTAAAVAYARSRTGDIAFAVRTRQRLYGYRADHAEWSASVVKAMLLVAYLDSGAVRNRALTSHDTSVLGPMIEASDNGAAQVIFDTVGQQGLRALAQRVGMTGFATNPVWGATSIDARDQTHFFLHIDSDVVARHRSYAMRLLRNVIPAQRWGIGELALPGWELYFKGGWGYGTGLEDHQVALLVRGCARVSVAVLTMYDGSQAYGEATLKGIFTRLLRGLPAAGGSRGRPPAPERTASRRVILGRSVRGRAIVARVLGPDTAPRKLLVVGCLHGNECAGVAIVSAVARRPVPAGVQLWLVAEMNPDGAAADTRQNAHGIDLNRNFPYRWQRIIDPTYDSGPRAGSEPETRVAMGLIRRIRPAVTIWYHQHMDLVDPTGGDFGVGRRYAQLARHAGDVPGVPPRHGGRMVKSHIPRHDRVRGGAARRPGRAGRSRPAPAGDRGDGAGPAKRVAHKLRGVGHGIADEARGGAWDRGRGAGGAGSAGRTRGPGVVLGQAADPDVADGGRRRAGAAVSGLGGGDQRLELGDVDLHRVRLALDHVIHGGIGRGHGGGRWARLGCGLPRGRRLERRLGRLDRGVERQPSPGLTPLDREPALEPAPDPGHRHHERADDDERQGPHRVGRDQTADQEQRGTGHGQAHPRANEPAIEGGGERRQRVRPRRAGRAGGSALGRLVAGDRHRLHCSTSTGRTLPHHPRGRTLPPPPRARTLPATTPVAGPSPATTPVAGPSPPPVPSIMGGDMTDFSEPLREEDVDPDPVRQFHAWFAAAAGAGVRMPEAAAVATAANNGTPSVRMVLVKQADEDGFVFYTNYESRKGRELAVNPSAALLFYWDPLGRQVRIEGGVQRTGPEASAAYVRSRPRGSQLSALASPQSRPVQSRAVLEARVAELADRYADAEPPLPEAWGGFRLTPQTFEFWQNRSDRLHDRLLYRRRPEGGWSIERLAP